MCNISSLIFYSERTKFDGNKFNNKLFFIDKIHELISNININRLKIIYLDLCKLEIKLTPKYLLKSYKFIISGSLLKETYIDGISDIDILIPINESIYSNYSPNEIIESLFNYELDTDFEKYFISANKNALRLRFKNLWIELVPVRISDSNLLFPNKNGKYWKEIHPNKVTYKIKELEKQSKHMISLTIRIVKVILLRLFRLYEINSYIIEFIIIEFISYKKEDDLLELILVSLKLIRDRILYPISDVTRQYKYIDQNLGVALSDERKRLSVKIDKIINLFQSDYFYRILLEI